MLVVDTNVLVRLFSHDHPAQTRHVETRLDDAHRKKEMLWISDLVFAEALWVLTTVYKISRQEGSDIALALLGDERFTFENSSRLAEAVGFFRDHTVDFTDAYCAAAALEYKSNGVISFDKDIRKLPVRWVEP